MIQRAQTGSSSALGELLDQYRSYLLGIANNRLDSDLRPKVAPSDIVQGSMLVATQEFETFRGTSANEFRTWLVRIISSQLIDSLRQFVESEKRRLNREVSHGDSRLKQVTDGSESPSKVARLQEEMARLLEAIASLPEHDRDVVQLRYLEGLTFSQIAERLSIPATTCRRRWLNGVETLGRELEEK